MIENKKIESKNLFNHLNEIRETKSVDYYDLLSEQEKKGFNQYIILMGLSMDKECIQEISFISKYLNLIPNKQFYKICCDIIPYNKKFSKWIKSNRVNFDKEVLSKISEHYQVSISEANQYCEVMVATNNLSEIKEILEKYGMSEKQIKGLLK